MKQLLKMAFRNVFRFKRRTFITFTTTSVGLALLIFGLSLMNGMDKQSIQNIINSQTSHLKVFADGYFEKKDELPVNITINDSGKVGALLENVPGVEQVEKRVLFGAGLIKGMDELPCLGVGMEPDRDPDVFNISESLVEGEWLKNDDMAVLIGVDIAKDMELKTGDIVTLRMIASEDDEVTWNAVDLEVKGIFDTGNPKVDRAMIFMPLSAVLEGLSMGSQVTEIVVRLNNDNQLDRARQQIKQVLDSENRGEKVFTWKELAGDFLMISKMKTKNNIIIVMIMLLVASLGIINTMLMAVLERTREIGMLKAMGMKQWEIVSLFVMEGGFIGMFGSLLGCVLGGLTSWYLEVYGYSLSSFSEAASEITASVYPLKDVFYADLTIGLLVSAFLLGTVISLAATLYPAMKAARMNPVEALRHI